MATFTSKVSDGEVPGVGEVEAESFDDAARETVGSALDILREQIDGGRQTLSCWCEVTDAATGEQKRMLVSISVDDHA